MMSNNQIPLIVIQDEKLGKKTMDDIYKSVLVENKTSDADITLFIYCSWDLVCWLSYNSKIIKPGEKYLYRSEGSFKFELRAHGEKSKRKVILPTVRWDKDMLFHVTGSVSDIDIDQKELSEFPQEKQICLRRQNMEKEISADCGRNLYEILKLNIKEVREEKGIKKQNEMIKKAYHREMLRWHPDRNPECGDLSICQEIIYAYGVLCDPASRARYNNEADFNNGWTSKSKWKAIFWSECNTEEQKKEFRKRIGLLLLSAGLAPGGLALTFFTAGMAAPALIASTVIAGALMGGGIQSGLRTIKLESIKEGCDVKKYAASLAIGAVGGALVGGVAVGATAGIAGIANGAAVASGATMGQYIAMGSITGAGGGAISSVTNDIDRKLVSKEDVTWKELVGHGIAGALIGGTAGIVGGAVTKGIVGKASSVAATNIEGETFKQIAIRSGAKAAKRVARSMSSGLRRITEEATGGTLGIVEAVAEERLDISSENKPIGEHAINGAISTAVTVGLHAGVALSTECGKQTVSCVKNRRQDLADPKQLNEFIKREIKLVNKSVEIHEPKYKPSFDGFDCGKNREENVDIPFIASLNVGDCSEHESNHGRIRLISEGDWRSKMILQYMINGDEGKKEEKEVIGNGGSIMIPEEARNIEVRFQVQRFIATWCDVKKYDRINKSWCKPITAHVFNYELPPIRTFTLAGSLYFEAVMHVRDEHWNDIVEMQ